MIKFPISTIFCNVENSIKREMRKNCLKKKKSEKKHYTSPPPPPQTTPTFEIQNQKKEIEDIMDIDSNCPYLLFGETTSHLTSKLNVMDGRIGTNGRTNERTDGRGVSIKKCNVENSIKT